MFSGVNVAKKTWRNVNEVSAASRDKEIVSLCWADTQQTQVLRGGVIRRHKIHILRGGVIR